MTKIRLSFCSMAKDSLSNIRNMVESVRPIVDEIIIIDSGSESEVVKYEREVADKVISLEFKNDFSILRNRSIEESSGDWILTLDSDETISPALAQKIPELIAVAPEEVEGYYLKRIHYIDEPRPLPDYWKQLRLYRRKARYFGSVHESIKNLSLTLPVDDEDCYILHHNNRSQQHVKAMEYTQYLKDKLTKVRAQGDEPMVEYYSYKLWVQEEIYNLETDPNVNFELLSSRYKEYEIKKKQIEEKRKIEKWVIT